MIVKRTQLVLNDQRRIHFHQFVFFHRLFIFLNSKPNRNAIHHRIYFVLRSIAIPRLKTFQIINDDAEPLEIYSLTNELNGFYSSAISQPTIVPPNGGSLSINIYFLPRTLGPVQISLIIKTNRANFSYQVNESFVFD